MSEITHRASDHLPIALYRAEQVRELDRQAIEGEGIAGFTLMRRAGRVAFEQMLACWPEFLEAEQAWVVTIVCGTGNNAGDGFVLASLARQRGIAVRLLQLGDGEKLSGDALLAKKRAEQSGIVVEPFSESLCAGQGVVVDALLGTGLTGQVRAEAATAIAWMNEQGLPLMALDVPSGLCSDRGVVLGCAVQADVTVTFIGMKQGLLTAEAPDYCGDIYYYDLSVPPVIFTTLQPSSYRLLLSQALASLPPRKACAHKGHFGHALITGGDEGMGGAVILASEAAARGGAGLVSCATREAHVAPLLSRCPEVMVKAINEAESYQTLLQKASAVAIGPGLGREAWGQALLLAAYQCDLPLVVDADALNLLAEGQLITAPHRDNWLLTPHPAEAARLLACTTADIQADRFAAAKALQHQYGGAVVLKGAGSVVVDAEGTAFVCSYGNPGMASGGMGDVLSGLLAALLAQGLSVSEAAKTGVCLHAVAADRATIHGEAGLLASDIMQPLRSLIN